MIGLFKDEWMPVPIESTSIGSSLSMHRVKPHTEMLLLGCVIIGGVAEAWRLEGKE